MKIMLENAPATISHMNIDDSDSYSCIVKLNVTETLLAKAMVSFTAVDIKKISNEIGIDTSKMM